MIDPWEMLEKAHLRGQEMAKAFGALQGHVMNAIIDLETGTRADATRTLKAGQRIVAEYQATLPKLPSEDQTNEPG